jgi:hypothetical protein
MTLSTTAGNIPSEVPETKASVFRLQSEANTYVVLCRDNSRFDGHPLRIVCML